MNKDENLVVQTSALGTSLAVVVSYSLYHHLGWAIVHGAFSWFYILYYLCTRN